MPKENSEEGRLFFAFLFRNIIVVKMQNIITLLRTALSEAHYDKREARSIILLLLEEVCAMSHTEAVMTLSMYPPGSADAGSATSSNPSVGKSSLCLSSVVSSAHKGKEIPLACQEKLIEIGEKLRRGIPVQQALGYEWFCGRCFKVTSDVLIPRPETAELVEWILSAREEQPAILHPLTCVDIGTGSGCIAISLAAALSDVSVFGVDISTAALAVAHENAAVLGVDNVTLVHGNILKWAEAADNEGAETADAEYSEMADTEQRLIDADWILNTSETRPDKVLPSAGASSDPESYSQPYPQGSHCSYPQSYSPSYAQRYPHNCSQACSYLSAATSSSADPFVHYSGVDLIVSNPPYIGMKEREEMSSLVWAHEPESALFVPDDDPLLFYRAIARWGKKRLSHGGWLYFEMNLSWARETARLMAEEGYVAIEIRPDVTGRDRMLRCQWP